MITTSCHYKVLASIKSIDDLKAIFPDGLADEMNWCVLSTSGVHGTYATLDDIERGDREDRSITVLVIQPRLVVLHYGHIEVTEEDIPWLRRLVASTLDAVVASQRGNLPRV